MPSLRPQQLQLPLLPPRIILPTPSVSVLLSLKPMLLDLWSLFALSGRSHIRWCSCC